MAGSVARNKKRQKVRARTIPEGLTLALSAPGMTPLMKAGIGGLAASLRAYAEETGRGIWPAQIEIGDGVAHVTPTGVQLTWSPGAHESVLGALFDYSFGLTSDGLISLPGAYAPAVRSDAILLAHLQDALKRTFLSHGKSTAKRGEPTQLAFTVDDAQAYVQMQPYSTYAQREATAAVLEAMGKGVVDLASWAYPGAVVRHNAYAAHTKAYFTAEEVLAACFALVGCISYAVPQKRSGVLVIPEPTELVAFARRRWLLTARGAADTTVAGASDAALLVELALRHDAELARGIGRVHAALMRGTDWDSKQKYRVQTLALDHVSTEVLDDYERMAAALPSRVRIREEKEGKTTIVRPFVARSWLRWLAAENLARGRRWYDGFATATTDENRPRWVHRFRTRDDKLGALYSEDRKGLEIMTNDLDLSERTLVESVHIALRQRFGAIADESRGDGIAAMRNRWNRERDRWRHAFAGAKTQEQVRSALADLWSRAGANRALRENWTSVIPLLRADSWQLARDLSLIALASYAARVEVGGEAVEETLESSAEAED